MKTLLTTFKILALVLMLGAGNSLMAQTAFQFDDGALPKFTTGTFPNAVSTTVTSQASTVIMTIGDGSAANVTFSGDLSSYYGKINYFNGSKLSLAGSSGGRTISAQQFNILGSSATTLEITSGGDLTFGGTTGGNGIAMGSYGVLDFSNTTGNLTLTNGSLYFDNNGSAKPYVLFPMNTTPANQKAIVINEESTGKIYSNGTDGVIDVPNNFRFKMPSSSSTSEDSYTFIFAKTKVEPTFTSANSPNLDYTQSADGIWENASVSVTTAAGISSLKLTATLVKPVFQSNDDNSYKTWSTFSSTSGSYKLLKTSANMGQGYSLSNNYTIDLQNFNITDATNTLTVNDGKALTLTSTNGTPGKYSGKLSFGGNTSELRLVQGGLLGTAATFADASAAGKIIYGDGITSITDAITLSANINSKVSTIIVKGNVSLTINPAGAE